MAEARVRRAAGAKRVTSLALLLSIGGVAAALIAAVGSGQGAWHFRTGFTILQYAFFAAATGAVLALAGLFIARRRGVMKLAALNLLALVVALGFVLYVGSLYRTAKSVPAIHDISTNLDDVPQFAVLKVRSDNLEKIPDNDDPKMEAMDPESRLKAVQRQAYPDIRTLHVPWPVKEATKRAEQLARQRGWDIAKADPAAGTIEATATSRFFRFKDDVAVRARPDPAGAGSLVDMRSISRVGTSDLGVNAARVRAFLADLQKS